MITHSQQINIQNKQKNILLIIIKLIQQQNTQNMQKQANASTYSQRRVKQLQARSDHIRKQFDTINFYQGIHLNINKLKQKIQSNKKKLLQQKQLQKLFHNKNFIVTKQQLYPYITPTNHSHHTPPNKQSFIKNKLKSSSINDKKSNRSSKRLSTDNDQYHNIKKNTIQRHQHFNKYNKNMNQIDLFSQPHQKNKKNYINKQFSFDLQSQKNNKTIQFDNRKYFLKNKQQLLQLQSQIQLLWSIYQLIVSIMKQISKQSKLDQSLIHQYILLVNTQKLQFIHTITSHYTDPRIQRTIRLSRLLQNISIFQTCINQVSIQPIGQTQLINYLGFSSSSVIFLIKILLLMHQNPFHYSPTTTMIIQSIRQFQLDSYRTELRSLKQVFRRLQHNNQIISMIKTRSGKKHIKYCQQFMLKLIKSIQKQSLSFYQYANNIFQFLSFYLHYQQLASNFAILSIPPTPFLFLTHQKTIVIEPWGVLAYRGNNKIVLRQHTGKFLAQILSECNLIFWTQLMPKQAQMLINLMPIKDNIYWLYKYHCQQINNSRIKIIQMIGCDINNTIIIDSTEEHFCNNQNIGINMGWYGDRNDFKLLKLSEIIQQIFQRSQHNKTTLKQQLVKIRPSLDNLSKINRKLKYKINKCCLNKNYTNSSNGNNIL